MDAKNTDIRRQLSIKHRFAAHILMFDVEPFILRAIDNCAPYVEKIYLAYSERPWVYNAQARESYANPTRLDLVEQSPWRSKIEIIQGEWDREEDQRNACVEKAKKDGIDFLIIHDADEFYTKEDYISNIKKIDANSGHEGFRTPWCSFWKNISWIIENNGNPIVGYPQFAINCAKNIHFTHARNYSAKNEYMLDGLCYHLSFVRTDQDLLTKLSTWGHSHEVDIRQWYADKWLQWHPEKKNLHPVTPPAWAKAVPFTGKLPDSLIGFEYGSFSTSLPSRKEKLCDAANNLLGGHSLKDHVKNVLRKVGLFSRAKHSYMAIKKLATIFDKAAGKLHRLYTALAWKHIYRKKVASAPSIRLHLGCGSNRINGMINCEYRATTAADIVMDCSDLSKFLTRSVDLIFSHAFFEHLYFNQRLPLLRECRRIIKENKRIIFLGLPDLHIIAKSYMDGADFTAGRQFDASVVYRYTHGDPEIAPDWWTEQLHKTLFDKQVVSDLLHKSGFEHFALFNYRYRDENIPLNLGFIAWHGQDNNLNILQELSPFLDKFHDVKDCMEMLTTYNCTIDKGIYQ
ncbi:MAG: methyltransferase domain-containing protein [Desulfovibrio sp.]|uniref:methyltransferase domain-containing protein n=1 Tax=Desulfovibrio sp. TaxID=885 RepID=UPI0039E45E4F